MGRLQTERFRAFHRARGESYRWLKASRTDNPRGVGAAERDGRIYVEGFVDPSWKALIHQTDVAYEDKEFGLIAKGTAAISVMPDETFLARLDRVILTERRLLSRALVSRGAGLTDKLAFAPVVLLVAVRKNTTEYAPGTDYKLTGDTVEWLNGHGPGEGEKYSVEYTYCPTYVFIGSDRAPRAGDAGLLPQRGALLLWQPG